MRALAEEQEAADIEGNTALWERERQAMAVAVDHHLALLRSATTAHGGIFFNIVGDATQVAFASAPDAVATALEAQRAMLTESWPAMIGPLRVRTALHAGEAVASDGDYLAAPLNRLASCRGTGSVLG